MKFVDAVCCDAHLFSVDGVASIERVSKNRIRVGFYVSNTIDGEIENRIVAYLDWDRDVYIKLFDIYASVYDTVVRPDFPIAVPPPMEQRN